MTARLMLIRHAKPQLSSRTFTRTSRGRQWDPPLDGDGHVQAGTLAARLSMMERPVRILVSPFERCRQTIQPFADVVGMEPQIVDDIGEVFIGEWEGMRFEEIVSGDEELARRFREQEAMFSMSPGGESGRQLRGRVVPAIERSLEDIEDGTMIAVTHGGVINAYLGHVMGIDHDMFFLPDYASINTVQAEGGRREMRFLNDVRHLTDPGIFARSSNMDGGATSEGRR